ncbi:hypothetical protein DFP78_102122 [Photobacterium lutimaris]|nr:hypothetical protein DFP78_102122 [Photobacterium lutimaris]
MQDLPICSQCGQDEEFLVSETGHYLCICGHQLEMVTPDANKDKSKHSNYIEANQSSCPEPNPHHSPSTTLH